MKKGIKVSSAKAKARYLQNWVAEKISNLLNLEWGHEEDKLIRPRSMGQSGTDVELLGEAFVRFPVVIECKSGENWSIKAAIKQVKEHQRKEKRGKTQWLVFLKSKEFKKPIVVMDADYFFYLNRSLKDG